MKPPYKIIVIPNLNQEPTNEQLNWMFRSMRMVAESLLSMGYSSPCIQLLVYPMDVKWGRELPDWVKRWPRPQHSTIELLRAAPRMAGHESMILATVLGESADETWCLNGPGHTEGSRCVPAKVWRLSRENQRVLPQIKLVPSWVLSDEPPKPAKEKKHVKPNGNPRPVQKARPAPAPRSYEGSSGTQGSAWRNHSRRR